MGPIWAHMGPNPDRAPTRTGPQAGPGRAFPQYWPLPSGIVLFKILILFLKRNFWSSRLLGEFKSSDKPERTALFASERDINSDALILSEEYAV